MLLQRGFDEWTKLARSRIFLACRGSILRYKESGLGAHHGSSAFAVQLLPALLLGNTGFYTHCT